MALFSSNRASQTRTSVPSITDSRWRGVLVGLIPLLFLIGISTLTLLMGAVARQFFFKNVDFFTQQRVSMLLLSIGLVLAVLAYAVAIALIMRRIGAWQQGSGPMQARAALWAFVGTAVVIILPLMLAIVLPQHPAP